jgi:hypothetical protein
VSDKFIEGAMRRALIRAGKRVDLMSPAGAIRVLDELDRERITLTERPDRRPIIRRRSKKAGDTGEAGDRRGGSDGLG